MKARGASKNLSTRAEAVAALGLASARVLDRMVERGAPGPAPGKKGTKRYDVDAIRAWVAARRTNYKPIVDLAAERAKLTKVQRQLASLKLRQVRTALVSVKDVEEVHRGIAAAVRALLLAVPRQAVMAGLPVDHEPLIRRLITEALRELSGSTTMQRLRSHGQEDDAA